MATTPWLIAYLWEAFYDHNFGWVAIAPPLATLGLFAIRWDGKCLGPLDSVSMALLLTATGCGLAAIAWPFPLLGFSAALPVYCAACWAQRDRKRRRMWPVVLPMFVLLMHSAGSLAMSGFRVPDYASSATSSLLFSLEIPHMLRTSAVATVNDKFFPLSMVQTWAALPMFVLIAVSYSVLRRRSLLAVACNVGMAFFCCVAFHVCTVATLTAGLEWGWGQFSMTWVRVAWAIGILLVFVSADRFFEALLFPVREDSDESLVNPVVYGWNTLLGKASESPQGEELSGRTETRSDSPRSVSSQQTTQQARRSSSRRRRAAESPRLPSWWMAVQWSIAAVLGLTAAIWTPNVPARMAVLSDSHQRQWAPSATIFSDLISAPVEVEHRGFDRQVRSGWGNVSDVWTFYGPVQESEFVLSQQPPLDPSGNPLAALETYRQLGWKILSGEDEQEDSGDAEGDKEAVEQVPASDQTASESTVSEQADEGEASATVVDRLQPVVAAAPVAAESAEEKPLVAPEAPAQGSQESEEQPSRTIRLNRSGAYALLIEGRITDKGKILDESEPDFAPDDEQKIWTVQLFASLDDRPSTGAVRLLESSFDAVINRISADLSGERDGASIDGDSFSKPAGGESTPQVEQVGESDE